MQDELKAAFDICRLREFKVMAHATHPEAVKNAIGWARKHDTWYVPTLAISHLTSEQASNVPTGRARAAPRPSAA